MILLAVFGSPVEHSLSPRIHRHFARQAGLEVDYRAIAASAADFPDRVRALEKQGGRGCNITAPFKHAAWRLATRCGHGAERARAVNTLAFEGPGDWLGENTDGPGLVDDLAGPQAFRLDDQRICLLGAGGAAAGVLAALLESGASEVVVANRTARRARELVAGHADLGRVRACSLTEVDEGAPFGLLINSTSLGHGGEAPPLSPDWLAVDALCYDLNYGAAAEPMRRACGRLGLRYSDGLGMLVAQAARSFELWTGRRPDCAPVLDELRSET